MRKAIFISLLLVVAVTSRVFASDVVMLTEIIDEQGKRSVYNVSKAWLNKTPSWNLDKEPPFPVHKAAAVAEHWIKERHPKFTKTRIASVSLSPLWEEKFKDKWYYSVAMQAGADLDGVTASSFFNVILLMDGTVVAPTSLLHEGEERPDGR